MTENDALCANFKISDLFTVGNRVPYAQISVNGREEIHPVYSEEVKHLINRTIYEKTGNLPGKTERENIQNALAAKAVYDGKSKVVWVRTAKTDDGIEIDLNNEDGQCIRVTPVGWQIAQPSALFYRPASAHQLLLPMAGGAWEMFERHFHTRNEEDLRLLVGFILASFKPQGPYPALVLQGEQGSAKSTTAQMIKKLVDPSLGATRGFLKKEHDLFIAAKNNHLLSFDNISLIKNDLSDTLCRLATGGSFSTRSLYTNEGEILIELCKPVMLNGITDFVNRADLASRSVIIELPSIPEDKRRTSKDVMEAFEQDVPLLLGVIMDGLSSALRNEHSVELERMPRMADMVLWCTAAEQGLKWAPESFLNAFENNQLNAVLTSLSNDPLAIALRSFMTHYGKKRWEGTATSLLQALDLHKPYMENLKSWPSTPGYLSQQLTRLAPNLRKIGLNFVGRERTSTERALILELSDGWAPNATDERESERMKWLDSADNIQRLFSS